MSDQTLKQVTQSSYGVSILGGIQNSTGHHTEQHAPADPDLSSGVVLDNI